VDSSDATVAGYTGVTASGAGYTGTTPAYGSPPASSAANYDAVTADEPATDTAATDYPVTAQTAVPTAQAPAGTAATPADTHRYVDEWEIGPASGLVTAKGAMTIMKNSPNVVFPFTVTGQNGETTIQLDHSYNLENAMVPGDKNPVKVVQADDTSFTFETLPGHFRGPGRTIKFHTLERDGTLYLQQEGVASNNVWDYTLDQGARLTWWYQSQNLKAAIFGGSRDDFPGSFPPTW
jgi:hypothetical protein